jgi:uncharacterized membrane protein (DUF106 family)
MSAPMADLLQILNDVANTCGKLAAAPVAWLPGWLSLTIVSIVTGFVMLIAFKYTSHQTAVRRARNQIKANLLALSLFQDNLLVSFRSQLKILRGAIQLLLLAIVPMLVMIVPMCLMLGQLALWYQARPLAVGEDAVLTVTLREPKANLPHVQLVSTTSAQATLGPVRIPSRGEICWNVRGLQAGYHQLTVQLDKEQLQKELAVGKRPMRVSRRRPPREWSEMFLNPAERPLPEHSIAQSIDIDYAARNGWITGSGWWLVYWFGVSMLAAFAFRPWLKVHI